MLTFLVTLLLSSAGIVLKMFLVQWGKSLINFDPKSSGDFPPEVNFGHVWPNFFMVLEGDFVKHFASSDNMWKLVLTAEVIAILWHYQT